MGMINFENAFLFFVSSVMGANSRGRTVGLPALGGKYDPFIIYTSRIGCPWAHSPEVLF